MCEIDVFRVQILPSTSAGKGRYPQRRIRNPHAPPSPRSCRCFISPPHAHTHTKAAKPAILAQRTTRSHARDIRNSRFDLIGSVRRREMPSSICSVLYKLPPPSPPSPPPTSTTTTIGCHSTSSGTSSPPSTAPSLPSAGRGPSSSRRR